MSRTRRGIGLLLCLTLIASMAAGCGSTPGDDASSTASQAATTAEASATPQASSAETTTASEEAATPSYPPSNNFTKFDPPITITTAIALRDSDSLRFNDTIEDNPVTRWYRDTMGIIEKFHWQLTDTNDAMKTKIQLALASGEELPDVLYITDKTVFSNLIEADMIQPIDEAYEKYATERVRKAFDNNSIVWTTVLQDGKKWGLPQIADGYVGSTTMWIRQDWLDAVGMKAPTTIQEFEQVLEAFTNKDPDKNGVNDTYGVAVGGNAGYQQPLRGWMGDLCFVFGQQQPYSWLKGDDGKLYYGSTSPVVKDGLSVISGWLGKGFMSKDFGTQGPSDAAAEFAAGKAGIFFGPGWCGGWPIGNAVSDAKAKGLTFDAQPYPIPSGVTGEVGRMGSEMSYGKYVFRKGFEHMDAIFQLWDISFGQWIEDPEFPFAAGFGEGYDFVMKDGEPSWDIPDGMLEIGRYQILNSGNTPPGSMEGPNIWQRVAAGKADTIYEKKAKAMNGELAVKGFSTVFGQLDKDVPILFYGLATPTMKEKEADLKVLDEATQLKIIYGEAAIDTFDTFVTEWTNGGGAEITKEINAWYEQAAMK